MYRPLSIFMLLLALVPVSIAQATILRVGTGTGCTHATIQDAINVAQTPGVQVDEVRVSRSVSWTAQALVVNTSKPVNLHGGYATCAQDVADSIATEVSGAGGSAAPVFRITANAGGLVRLRRFFITGGDVSGDGYGG
ncbi:MAG TPA: hypothetical protein PKZ76_02215, partial [Xanthomonadaceae bacterium]|nr:hypothetical protein [Xanthomonadaceae bacterium]